MKATLGGMIGPRVAPPVILPVDRRSSYLYFLISGRETAPMVAVYPGLAIFITVLGVNLFGDGIRDILDPRLAEK